MIVRRTDWLVAMNDALAAIKTRKFNWASWNCCHFVDAVVLAMAGTAPLGEYRDAFIDEASAWAVLNERDGNLRAACKRVFGGCIKAPFAMRGDVVLARGGMAIGICIGRVAAFASDDGVALVRRPMSEISHAFPLGWPEAVIE